MFIKKIKLRNFKSFKRAEIEFRDNFTVITGPNGSGKSNVIDSILFCFGITSSKVLRAERLTDLIRSNQNEAEVTIELENCVVKRRIKKTDKGYYSYYYINGKSVSYSEVERLIEKLGLNTDYNVIMQGDVTRIAEMTPVQRRKIIEDVAGISEFEEKKEKALEELENVKQDIEKVEVVIREVEERLSKLSVEREEALRYRRLMEEKDKLKYYRRVHDYLSLLKEAEDIKKKINSIDSERDDIVRRLAEINSELAKLNEEVKELSEKITSFKDERLKKINEEISSTNSEIASLKKTIGIYSKEVEELEREKEKTLIALQKMSEELEKVDKELKDVEVRKESLEAILSEKENQLKILRMKYDELSSDYRSLRDELDRKVKILNDLKERRTTLLKEKEKVLEGLRRIGMEIEEIEINKEKIKLDKIFDEIVNDERELIIVKNEIDKVRLKIFEIDGEIFKLRDEIAKVDKELRETEIELVKVSAVQRPRAVETILKAREEGRLKGIYGTVSQLCSVDEKYALALEVAGGNALNFIVVEGEDVAIKAVKYLKEVEGGRASFIPLNRINVNVELDKSVLKEDGVVDYAVNLIKCDKKFKPVFEFVYKDTLVVRDIDVAKRFINRFRVVTLEGDLIEKSGVITGGSVKKKSIAIFDREIRLREKVDELRRRKIELESKLADVEALRKDLQRRFEELNEKATRLKERISANRSKVEELKSFLIDVERRLKEKRKESEVLNARAIEIDRKLADIEDRIRKVEREIRSLEVKLKDERIAKLSSKMEEIRTEIEKLKDLLSVLSSDRSRLCAKREQTIRMIEEYKERIEGLEKKINSRMKEIEKAKLRMSELESHLRVLKEKEREISEEVSELRRKRDELIAKIESLEREKNQKMLTEKLLEEKLKGLREKLEEVERELEKYDVEVPSDLPPLEHVKRRLAEVEDELSSFGEVNMKAIQEYEEVSERLKNLVERRNVLDRERKEILEKIKRIEEMKRSAFISAFNAINENFKQIVRELADGEGEIYLDKDDPFSSGLHIRFKPFGKPIQRLESMSGGEKSLLTLAFIFAIQRYKPAPFYAFDEVDMFLDGVNVGRLAKMIKKLSKDAQFIVVSLRKPMLEEADHVVGITRGGDGESMVTAIQLK